MPAADFDHHSLTRHGETPGQLFIVSRAHAVVLSVWQLVQGLGILYSSVFAGEMKLKVWLRTLMSAMVCSIFGM